MKDFISLKLLDKFKSLFEKAGIDYDLMRSILKIKFTMDGRRSATIMNNYNKKDDGKDNSFLGALFIYGLTGVFIMIMILSNMSLFAKMSFAIGIIMFMVLTTMIADFSSVLLDVRDKNILASKPIDAKTLNAAKIIHIFIYISRITLALSALTLVAGTIKHGFMFFGIFLIELILISLFIIFLSAFLYNFILIFFDGEKLKDMINYFQIILSFIMIIGYQLIGDMFRILDFKLEFAPKWWVYIIPPAWFASPFEMFINGDYSRHYIILSVLALLVPAATVLTHFKFVIPNFEKNLSKLNNSSKGKSSEGSLKMKLHVLLRNAICLNNEERQFYTFTQRIVSNERTLKLRIYPSLGFAVIFPLVMIFRMRLDISSLSSSKSYFLIYMVVVFLASIVFMIAFSDKYNGAWIYKVLPINSPASILKGSYKGFMMKFEIPAFLFTSLIFIVIYGVRIIFDVVLVFLVMLLLTLFLYKVTPKRLPFSHPFKNTNDGTSMAAGFASMALSGGMAALHYFFINTLTTRLIFGGVLLISIVILWNITFRVSWKDIV